LRNTENMQEKLVTIKGLLINPQGKVLIVRKIKDGKVRWWELPGGRMNVSEQPLETLKRELKEEIGFEVDVSSAKPVYVDHWGLKGDIVNRPIVGIFYIVQVGDGLEIKLSEEHDKFEWFDHRGKFPDDLSDITINALNAFSKSEGITLADPKIKGREGFGLIQLVTGNGKGKTTAGLGQAIRAHGAGKKVGIVFFDKGGDHYSERKVLEELGIKYVATGRDRIDPKSGRFDFSITNEDKKEAERGLSEARKMLEEDGYDLIVLDEINSTTDLKMLDEKSVLDLLDHKSDNVEVILTGRNAPESFIERAHLVTEMKLRKHYFYSGVKAREGLDF